MPMITSQILKSVENEIKSGESNIYSLKKKFHKLHINGYFMAKK